MSASTKFTIALLAGRHDRSAFSCGVAMLDTYLARQAGQDMRRRVTTVYVACVGDDPTVCGYYTLSASELHVPSLPDAVARRLPHYPGLPAVLLGRLAVDRRWQGSGLGASLLFDALRRCYTHNTFGVMFVLVDPLPEARAFYARYQFRDIPDETRMYLPMTEVARPFP